MCQINLGDKFAILIIPTVYIDSSMPVSVRVNSDMWALRSLPFGIKKNWQEWIGSIRSGEIENADLYLFAKMPSSKPQILDAENKLLKRRVSFFYWSLILSGFVHFDGTILMITGANHDGYADIRSISDFRTPQSCIGIRPEVKVITVARLHDAANLSQIGNELEGRCKRFWRSVKAFQNGIVEHRAGEKLHEYVRCIEGFICPDTGKTKQQFKSRTEIFIGPGKHDIVGEMFDIRSSVEHLHEPDQTIIAPTDRERRLILLTREIESEAIARYCIVKFMKTPSLWDFFMDDESLREFWKLPSHRRHELWRPSLNMDDISRSTDISGITDDMLGL